MNHRIRAREVRLIDDEGEQKGIVTLRFALDMAQEKGLDLIEVAPNAAPPVCKIMDYGRFKYEQAKKDREAHKKSRATELKTIRLEPRIDDHDVEFKTKNIQKFLGEGNKVKVVVMFRGRSITHPELGRRLLDQIITQIQETANVEKPASFEGRTLTMILSPKS